jgi:hypothetical protein
MIVFFGDDAPQSPKLITPKITANEDTFPAHEGSSTEHNNNEPQGEQSADLDFRVATRGGFLIISLQHEYSLIGGRAIVFGRQGLGRKEDILLLANLIAHVLRL